MILEKIYRLVRKNSSRLIVYFEFIFGKNDCVKNVFRWFIRIVEKSAHFSRYPYSVLRVDNRRLLSCGFRSKYDGAQARENYHACRPYYIDNVSRNDFVRTAG